MSREFENLVKQAVRLERELRAAENWRLSAAAWVAALIENSEKTPQEYDDFKTRLASKNQDQMPDLFSYLAVVQRGIAQGNYRSPPNMRHMHVVRGIAVGDNTYQNAKDQAEMLEGNIWLAWAVAAERAGARYPHVFGTDTDRRACESRVLELRNRRAVLLPKISESWQQDDLHVHDVRRDSSALIVFRLALPDLIQIMPKAGSGERLVTYLASRPDAEAWAA